MDTGGLRRGMASPNIIGHHDPFYSDPRSSSSRHSGGSFSSDLRPISSARSIPMGIPNSSKHDAVPPPLPPPTSGSFLDDYDHEPPHLRHRRAQPSYSNSDYGSLEGGGASWRSKGQAERYDDGAREGRSNQYGKDEGYSSLSSYATSAENLLPRMRAHDSYAPRYNNNYDSQLLKKLDSTISNPSNKSPPRSNISPTLQNISSPSNSERPPVTLPRMALAIHAKTDEATNSPRYLDTPLTASSQLSMAFPPRSGVEPSSTPAFERSPRMYTRRPVASEPASAMDERFDDGGAEPADLAHRMHQSRLDERPHARGVANWDANQGGSLKRRASGTVPDDAVLLTKSSRSDLMHRRDSGPRSSPTPRLTVDPHHGSISSISSAGRSGSYAGMSTATSLTSATSFGRRSPITVSPGNISPQDSIMSPYQTPKSATLSPNSIPMQRPAMHSRSASGHRVCPPARKLPGQGGMSKIPELHVCECCPKKPKKFDRVEELQAHAAEKQYTCNFCGNRFKNKNEAERHQNSLHVRRHSWSCSALSLQGYDRAFHESTTSPGDADSCGYCGEEFPRNGVGPDGSRQATEADWQARYRHLQDQHKFRECNSSKKFYRADHFRQHLKHSHAGTSGKWTNMLENACMIEEEPPQPIVR